MADDPQKNSQKTISSKAHTTENHGQPNPTLRAELEIPPTVINKYDTEKQKQQKFERKRFGVEILTLLILGIYTFFVGYQSCQMKIAADAAKTSADAADFTLNEMRKQSEALVAVAKANEKSDQTTRLRDRAYLSLIPSVLPYPPGNVTVWGIYIVIENAGVMPAKQVKLKYAISSEQEWLQAKWIVTNARLTIGPKQRLPLQGTDIPLDIIQQIIMGKAKRFILAEITYIDDFFPNKTRITQMSAKLNADPSGYSFSFFPNHNCTDDDCNKQ